MTGGTYNGCYVTTQGERHYFDANQNPRDPRSSRPDHRTGRREGGRNSAWLGMLGTTLSRSLTVSISRHPHQAHGQKENLNYFSESCRFPIDYTYALCKL